MPGGNLWMFACIAALTAIAIVGDLFESLLKRSVNMKDASAIIPAVQIEMLLDPGRE